MSLSRNRVRRLGARSFPVLGVLAATAVASGGVGAGVAFAVPDPILVFSGNTSLSPGTTYASLGAVAGRPISSTSTLPGSLAGNACVLLNLNQATFSGSQVTTLSTYLGTGGKVLMIGENDNYANNAAFRGLATALGSSMQIQNNAFDPGFRDTPYVDADPLTRDVKVINYAYTATVSFSPPARSLVRRSDGSATMMAAEAIGAGTLIALGDANAFTSPSGDSGVFVANLCGTRRETSSAVSCTPGAALVGATVTCTATVADADAGTAITPTGDVSFTQGGTGSGAFPDGAVCTLAASTTPGEASCSVSYVAATAGAQTLNGTYRGTTLSYGSTGVAAHAATLPVPPTAADGHSSAGVGEPQTFTVPIPAGGSVTLLDDGGVPATAVAIAGQGVYALDASSGTITFTPAEGFTGAARRVGFRVTDVYGQSSDATFAPTVVAAVATATTPVPAVAAPPAAQTAAPVVETPAVATPAPVVCVSRRAVTIHFRLPAAVRLRGLQVALDGKPSRALSPAARSVGIDMRGFAPSRVRVVVQAKTVAGQTLTAQRTYVTCAAAPKAGAPATLYLRAS
jgi:CshA-type fibril repeat protein